MSSKNQIDTEPTIDEMLEDPIIGLLMQRDGLVPGDVRAIWSAAAKRLQAPDDTQQETLDACQSESTTEAA